MLAPGKCNLWCPRYPLKDTIVSVFLPLLGRHPELLQDKPCRAVNAVVTQNPWWRHQSQGSLSTMLCNLCSGVCRRLTLSVRV